MVTEVVLAELACVVAQIVHDLGDCRCTRSQIGGASWKLRRDHACSQRIHACDKSISPGRAALHGVVCREHSTLVRESVDIGCFPEAEATMVGAHLHPPNVVAHDEKNVGPLLLL